MPTDLETPQAPAPDARLAGGGETTVLEAFAATWAATLHNDLMISEGMSLKWAMERRLVQIEDLTGVKLKNPSWHDYTDRDNYRAQPLDLSDPMAVDTLDQDAFATANMAAFEAEVDELRERFPDVADQIPTYDDMVAERNQRAQRLEYEAYDLGTRGNLLTGTASFAGGMSGAMLDPVNVATLPIGGPGKTVLGTAVRAAGTNAGIEAAMQPAVQSGRAEMGLESGWQLGARNVVYAGVGGGLLGGGLHFSSRNVPAYFDGAYAKIAPERYAAKEFDRLVREANIPWEGRVPVREMRLDTLPEPVQGYAGYVARQVEKEQQLVETSPGGSEPAAVGMHRDLLARAEAGEPVAAPPESITADDVPTGFYMFDPRDLNVDAKRFQFKSGGDAEGVTERLKDVTEWDPMKAGQVVVWEDAAGQRWIADGHQRTGLARRLQGEGAKGIRLYGTLLREVDGYTAERARAMAAGKNLAEGTGSSVDAAKVLKVDPGILDATISRSSTLVRHAQALSRLETDAFMMVVNEIVPEHLGALVGRLAADNADMHRTLMQLLADTKPDNAFEAESIIRQALAGPVRKEVQAGLFGEEEITQNLFRERAKVLHNAVKRLKQDRAVFETLVREEARIEGRGDNRLDRAANAERAQTDAEVTDIIQRLANRKGPVSGALDDAAQRFAGGDSLAAVTRDFTEAVQREVADLAAGSGGRPDAGYSGGGEAGGTGRAADPETENVPSPAAEENLDTFSDPVGDGAKAQVEALESEVRQSDIRLVRPEKDDVYLESVREDGNEVFYVHEGEKHIANIEYKIQGDELIIANVISAEKLMDAAYNTLGPGTVRRVLRALSVEYPDVNYVSGIRVGGARFGGKHVWEERLGTHARVKLPKRQVTRPVTEATEAGEQTLMDGVAAVTQRDRDQLAIEAGQNAPMRGASDDGGGPLFDGSMDQGDLLDAPSGRPDPAASDSAAAAGDMPNVGRALFNEYKEKIRVKASDDYILEAEDGGQVRIFINRDSSYSLELLEGGIGRLETLEDAFAAAGLGGYTIPVGEDGWRGAPRVADLDAELADFKMQLDEHGVSEEDMMRIMDADDPHDAFDQLINNEQNALNRLRGCADGGDD